MSNEIFNRKSIIDFYEGRLEKFGPTAQGVGWKNELAQNIRFAQFLPLLNSDISFTINDIGCGIGELFPFLLLNQAIPKHYYGYDLLSNMLNTAQQKHSNTFTTFKKIENFSEIEKAHYSVASGLFNIKNENSQEEWTNYVMDSIRLINEKSTKGFAFNLLTSYSDLDKMNNQLYYGSPEFFFKFCKINFSRNVALLHDYNEYDFTIIVRK